MCLALVAAFGRYGIPDDLLTDNGNQFTAVQPGGGETMFNRIGRENGIVHHLTNPRSPTTMGLDLDFPADRFNPRPIDELSERLTLVR